MCHLKGVHIVEIVESRHELWKPDVNKFLSIIKEFLTKLDNH